MHPERKPSTFDRLETLLTGGGDSRIALNAMGMNKYGCFASPQPDIISYASCTASTISPAAFAAAAQLHRRLEEASHKENSAITYERELRRIRKELLSLCGLTSFSGLDIIFGASGTDLHLFAAQLLSEKDSPLLIIMPDASETGSGVPAALQGRHFSSSAAHGNVMQGDGISDNAIEMAALKSRLDNGDARPADIVDNETHVLVERSIAAGKRVLLVLTDLSKTGLIIPSPACALALKQQFADKVDVLVDACQFRLSNATLRNYLEQDFLLAITGSKFVTGPAFSGALLVPPKVALRLRQSTLPPALGAYCGQAEWPQEWLARATLPNAANYGLLLRWEAALAELRVFHTLSENSVQNFLTGFAAAIQKRLNDDLAFVPLPVPHINRQPFTNKTWDGIATIFPFRLRHSTGAILSNAETAHIYERMKMERYYVGQPVACGALRLCLDMRLIVDALSPNGRGSDAIIASAMRTLDKAAKLAESYAKK